MAEELLGVRVTIEVETNKRHVEHTIAWNDTIAGTAERVAQVLAGIEAEIQG